VARGFTQQKGVDYDDTYASVTKPSTIKVLLSLVAHYDLECKQFNIMTAFLHTKMGQRTVYVEQPHGYEQGGADGVTLVCLLLRALYGLKQSPLLWYKELTKYLKGVKFGALWSDASLFKHEPTGAWIVIHVDDLFTIAKAEDIIEAVAKALGRRFQIKALGDVAHYLGCGILRDRKSRIIYMVQDSYIKRLGERFSLEGAKPAHTPLPSGIKLQKADKSGPQAKYLTNPTPQHAAAVEHCIRYLLGQTPAMSCRLSFSSISWATLKPHP